MQLLSYKEIIKAIFPLGNDERNRAIERIAYEGLRGNIDTGLLKEEAEADYVSATLDYWLGCTEECPEMVIDEFVKVWGFDSLLKDREWYAILDEAFDELEDDLPDF